MTNQWLWGSKTKIRWKKFNNQKQRIHWRDEGVTERKRIEMCLYVMCEYIAQTAQCFVICGDNESALLTVFSLYMHNETINWYVKHDKHFVNRHIHIDVCTPFRYSILGCCCILFLIWWINWNNILCNYDLMV